MDDGDLTRAVLRARAARLGRDLSATELAALAESVVASERTYEVLRARPIGLLSGRTDHALGEAWLRPGDDEVGAP